MAGVAGPMLRTRRREAWRLLTSLLAGELAAGLMLTVPAVLLGDGLRDVLPQSARLWLLAAVCALFGAADLANRTPRVRRQVPERLISSLSPGALGLVWGFDLGLLFTTQKTVSLIWAAIAAGVLLSPALAVAVLIVTPLLAGLTIVALSVWRRPGGLPLARWGFSVRLARRGSGLLLAVLCVLTAVRAWRG